MTPCRYGSAIEFSSPEAPLAKTVDGSINGANRFKPDATNTFVKMHWLTETNIAPPNIPALVNMSFDTRLGSFRIWTTSGMVPNPMPVPKPVNTSYPIQAECDVCGVNLESMPNPMADRIEQAIIAEAQKLTLWNNAPAKYKLTFIRMADSSNIPRIEAMEAARTKGRIVSPELRAEAPLMAWNQTGR